MKKIISMLLITILTFSCLTGCGKNTDSTNSDSNGTTNNKKIKIVTTIFPEYDWARAVLGNQIDHADVTMLLDQGVDLHSYQPTVDDIMKISSCDLFIYVGGESDGWVQDALEESMNKDMKVINLLEVLGDSVKEEELVEGMQSEEEHSHEEGTEENHQEDHEENHEEEIEYDEHVWLSVKNAQVLCSAIADALAEIDADNAETYQANVKAYNEQLSALNAKYQLVVNNASKKAILFGDRFPFRYLVDDYGLDYYAAFVGCSAETEASFETIIFLAQKVDELGLTSVFTIDKSNQKIAGTIIQNTHSKDQQILVLDSMQSVTSTDVKNGTTYLSIMESNLTMLETGLK